MKIELVALASPILQKGRIRQVLRVVNEKMQLADEQIKWSVDGGALFPLYYCSVFHGRVQCRVAR